jgi:cyclophilin family peptidyl-prolyl cis-trans isomerase
MKQLFLILALIIAVGYTATAQSKSDKDEVVFLKTNFGEIVLILFDETPQHKENFLKLAKSGFYDSTTFHRIIKNFMIQGGDPNSKDLDSTNDGQGGPGYTIPAEFNPKFRHIQGAVAAARMGDQVNPKKESSGSQFYIVENKSGTHFLDNNYTVFGQVIKGIEVVETIAEQPKNFMDRPSKNIRMSMKVKTMKKDKITKEFGYQFPS